MSSLYTKRGWYYISIMRQGNRVTKSIGTKNYRIAQKLRSSLEYEMLKEIHLPSKKKYVSFPKLVKIYLKSNPHWSKATLKINYYRLTYYVSNGLPKNPTSKAMSIQRVNNCLNWADKNGYKTNQMKINGDMKGESRLRVLNKTELNILLNNIEPQEFKKFVSFAYYTGARRGEIAITSLDMIQGNSFIVKGKSGTRIIKLTNQAKSFLEEFNYRPDYITHHFKKEARRLGINDIRFHDLRRTFGYNLIKQGKPIYEVSKLLGHSSVIVTERHYAPLMTTEIEDFTL